MSDPFTRLQEPGFAEKHSVYKAVHRLDGSILVLQVISSSKTGDELVASLEIQRAIEAFYTQLLSEPEMTPHEQTLEEIADASQDFVSQYGDSDAKV